MHMRPAGSTEESVVVMPYVSYHSVREQSASQRLSKSIAKFQSNVWSTGSDRSRHRDQCQANLA